MALQYRHERNGLYPTINGVRPDCHCDPLTFIPRDPLTYQPSASPYNFGETRYLSLAYPLKYDEIDNLIDQLLPKITFLDSFEGVEGALFYASIPCYETLFPDEGERDDPEDIQTWFEEVQLRGPSVFISAGLLYIGEPLSGGGRTTVNSSIHGYSDLYSNVDTLTLFQRIKISNHLTLSRTDVAFLWYEYCRGKACKARLSSSDTGIVEPPQC